MPRKKAAAAPEWSTSCKDWRERIVAGKTLIPFKPLFPAEAKGAIEQFGNLRIVDAPGSPTIAESCRPWVFDLAGAVFGSYDRSAGRQLVNQFLFCVSKKNSKSTIAAGLMLTALIRNWRKSAEFLILAPTVEIANNSFQPARDMIRADPVLSEMFHIQEHIRTITHRTTQATLKVVAADNEAVGGKKATGILVDELWIFGKRPNAENMLREATGGMASRPEGFVIYLTTQSDEPPAGVFAAKMRYARKVRDGEVEDKKFLPILYEFPPEWIEEKKHLDPANFHITNPNLHVSVDMEYLEREFAQAKEGGPESLAGFLAKHANIEIGLALMSDRWAGADYWLQNGEPGLTLEAVIEQSEVLTIGIDGGGLDDLLGFAVLGRRADGTWLHWGHAWAHPSVMERRKSEAPRFFDFERDGDLTIVTQIGDDVDDVADIVATVDRSGKLDKVGVDPVGIGAVVDAIVAAGVEQERIVGVSQGWKLSGAIKTAERKLAEGGLKHGGAPLLAWSVGNARVEPRGNAITITKQTAGTAKIDPLMALFNSVALMSLVPEIERSVYDMLAREEARSPAEMII